MSSEESKARGVCETTALSLSYTYLRKFERALVAQRVGAEEQGLQPRDLRREEEPQGTHAVGVDERDPVALDLEHLEPRVGPRPVDALGEELQALIAQTRL